MAYLRMMGEVGGAAAASSAGQQAGAAGRSHTQTCVHSCCGRWPAPTPLLLLAPKHKSCSALDTRSPARHFSCPCSLPQVYDVFGLDYKMALSTRPEGYLGELEVGAGGFVGAGARARGPEGQLARCWKVRPWESHRACSAAR